MADLKISELASLVDLGTTLNSDALIPMSVEVGSDLKTAKVTLDEFATYIEAVLPLGTIIGNGVVGGGVNRVLYIDSSGNLADNAKFKYLDNNLVLIAKDGTSSPVFTVRNSTDTSNLFEIKGTGHASFNGATAGTLGINVVTNNAYGFFAIGNGNNYSLFSGQASAGTRHYFYVPSISFDSAIKVGSSGGPHSQNKTAFAAEDFNTNSFTNTGFRANITGSTFKNIAFDVINGDIQFSTSGTGTKIGLTASDKFAFWGSTPQSQQVLSTGIGLSADDVISFLQSIGLCRQI